MGVIPQMPAMLVKTVIIVLLLAILTSLMAGMLFLVRDRSDKRRTLNSLKIRVALSVSLILFLLLSYQQGWIKPHGLYQTPDGQPPATMPQR